MKMQATEKQTKIFERAVAELGTDSQIIMALEEMTELSKELLLALWRKKGENVPAVTEEMADVLVAFESVRRVFNISEDEITRICNEKIARLEARLNAKTAGIKK